MTIKNGSLPAMPLPLTDDFTEIMKSSKALDNYLKFFSGLTKREMFAMTAMQGLCSHSGGYHLDSNLAQDAVMYADALLAELEKAK